MFSSSRQRRFNKAYASTPGHEQPRTGQAAVRGLGAPFFRMASPPAAVRPAPAALQELQATLAVVQSGPVPWRTRVWGDGEKEAAHAAADKGDGGRRRDSWLAPGGRLGALEVLLIRGVESCGNGMRSGQQWSRGALTVRAGV